MWSRGPEGYSIALPPLTRAVRALILINAGVYVAGFVLLLLTGRTLSPWFGLSLDDLVSSPLGFLRLVTYQFVHAQTDFLHILLNMLVLYFFGTMVEERIGARGTVRLYLLAGIAGGLLWLAMSALTRTGAVRVVGASGAVYGIMAYAALMAPQARVVFILVVLPLWVLALLLGLHALYNTLLSFRLGPGGVADAAHLGGMLFGLIWWRMHGRLHALRLRLEALAAARRRARAAADEAELDRILAKIKQGGIQSLTGAERRFLKRRSRRPGS